MKVKCIDASGQPNLTEGRIYECTQQSPGVFLVKNDAGQQAQYIDGRFKTVSRDTEKQVVFVCPPHYSKRKLPFTKGKAYEVIEEYERNYKVISDTGSPYTLPKACFSVSFTSLEARLTAYQEPKENKMSKIRLPGFSFHIASEHQIDSRKIRESLNLERPVAICTSEDKPSLFFPVIADQIYEKLHHCDVPDVDDIEELLDNHDCSWVDGPMLRYIINTCRRVANAEWVNLRLKTRIDVSYVHS
jgi:hypothetical protein